MEMDMEEERIFTTNVGQTSSESRSNSRHSLLERSQIGRTEKKCCRREFLVFGAFVLCVIIASTIAFLFGKHIATTERSKSSGQSGGPSSNAHKGNEEIFAQPLSNKYLLLNFDTKCDEPFCTKCKAQVPTPSDDHGDRYACESDSRVMNSTCFVCDNTCKNVSEIRTDLRCHGGRITNACCIITQMRGNEYCGPGGVYECYEQTPKCKCPSGKGGERCQEDTKIDLTCKCYNHPLEACGQDSMEKCANVTEFNSSNKCQMYAYKAGQKHNCECSKKDDNDDTELELCSTPHTDAQHENFSNGRQFVGQTLSGD